MEEFEKEYNPSYDYLLKKATIFAKKFDNIAESIKIFRRYRKWKLLQK